MCLAMSLLNRGTVFKLINTSNDISEPREKNRIMLAFDKLFIAFSTRMSQIQPLTSLKPSAIVIFAA